MMKAILTLVMATCCAAATAQTVEISTIGALCNSKVLTANVPINTSFWAAVELKNPSTAAVTVNWIVTVDNAEASYGEWTIQPGATALLTTIESAEFNTTGLHHIGVQYTDSAGDSVKKNSGFEVIKN